MARTLSSALPLIMMSSRSLASARALIKLRRSFPSMKVQSWCPLSLVLSPRRRNWTPWALAKSSSSLRMHDSKSKRPLVPNREQPRTFRGRNVQDRPGEIQRAFPPCAYSGAARRKQRRSGTRCRQAGSCCSLRAQRANKSGNIHVLGIVHHLMS